MFVDDENDEFIGYFYLEAFASRLMGSFEFDQFCVNYKKNNNGYDIRQTYENILQKDIRIILPPKGQRKEYYWTRKMCKTKTPLLFEIEEKIRIYNYFAHDPCRHSQKDIDIFFQNLKHELINDYLPILKQQYKMFKQLFDYISKMLKKKRKNGNVKKLIHLHDNIVLHNIDEDDCIVEDDDDDDDHHAYNIPTNPEQEEMQIDFHFFKRVCDFAETVFSILDISLNSL